MDDRASHHVVVIVAMPSELQHLPGLPELPHPGSREHPWPTVSWDRSQTRITAIQCGIGMIRAAAATESAIVRLRPDAILNFGCAGAHRRELEVGDVVIGTRSVAHASMVIGPDGVPAFDPHDGAAPPPVGQTGVPSDPALLDIARDAARGWVPEPWGEATSESERDRVREGVVASADIWTQYPPAIETVAIRHDSLCEDMEAGAIATVASLHGVPFLTVKDISNNELQQATVFEEDFGHLPEAEVGRRAAALIGRIIERLDGFTAG